VHEKIQSLSVQCPWQRTGTSLVGTYGRTYICVSMCLFVPICTNNTCKYLTSTSTVPSNRTYRICAHNVGSWFFDFGTGRMHKICTSTAKLLYPNLKSQLSTERLLSNWEKLCCRARNYYSPYCGGSWNLTKLHSLASMFSSKAPPDGIASEFTRIQKTARSFRHESISTRRHVG
jgi:hypothetical protein